MTFGSKYYSQWKDRPKEVKTEAAPVKIESRSSSRSKRPPSLTLPVPVRGSSKKTKIDDSRNLHADAEPMGASHILTFQDLIDNFASQLNPSKVTAIPNPMFNPTGESSAMQDTPELESPDPVFTMPAPCPQLALTEHLEKSCMDVLHPTALICSKQADSNTGTNMQPSVKGELSDEMLLTTMMEKTSVDNISPPEDTQLAISFLSKLQQSIGNEKSRTTEIVHPTPTSVIVHTATEDSSTTGKKK
ncbi:hypothetical protein BDR05DRAFT_997349 [Suillus weaverae]|nr:hypothetical protein BDR05DRAFT_997349 [Suillus weaverae]